MVWPHRQKRDCLACISDWKMPDMGKHITKPFDLKNLAKTLKNRCGEAADMNTHYRAGMHLLFLLCFFTAEFNLY